MSIGTTANSVYRDYVTDGIPASGENPPAKVDIRALFALVESKLNELGSISFASRAAAQAANVAPAVTAFMIAPPGLTPWTMREIANPGTLQGFHLTTNSGTRFWLLVGKSVPIEAFGATGDGVAEDQPAMLAARTYFTSISGGELLFRGNGIYLINAGGVNWNVDGLTLRSVGGKATIKRTTLLNATAMWEVRGLSSVAARDVRVQSFKFVHTATGSSFEATYTATAGQTTFSAATLGSTNSLDYVVFKNNTVLSPATPEYTYSGGNIVLTVGATAGDIIILKRTSASARSAALLSEGWSDTVRNNNVVFEDIDVESDGSLYVGVEHLWADRPVSYRVRVQGVANRAHYRYGRLSDGVFDDIVCDGRAATGILATGNKRVTDYLYDCNCYNATNNQTNCIDGKITVRYGYRGVSFLGDMRGCTFGRYDFEEITVYGVLFQDSPSIPAIDKVQVPEITGRRATSISVYCTYGRIHFGYIDIDNGNNHGFYALNGTSGSTESDLSIGRIVSTTMNGVGVYLQNQIDVDIAQLASNSNLSAGLYMNSCQFGSVRAQVRSNAAGGLLIDGACVRVNVEIIARNNTGNGVQILVGASNVIVEGRSIANTSAQLVDAGTTSNTARLLQI